MCPTFQNKCNVGYAFINMTNPQHIIPFYQVRDTIYRACPAELAATASQPAAARSSNASGLLLQPAQPRETIIKC
jgi:hypothetical protein